MINQVHQRCIAIFVGHEKVRVSPGNITLRESDYRDEIKHFCLSLNPVPNCLGLGLNRLIEYSSMSLSLLLHFLS